MISKNYFNLHYHLKLYIGLKYLEMKWNTNVHWWKFTDEVSPAKIYFDTSSNNHWHCKHPKARFPLRNNWAEWEKKFVVLMRTKISLFRCKKYSFTRELRWSQLFSHIASEIRIQANEKAKGELKRRAYCLYFLGISQVIFAKSEFDKRKYFQRKIPRERFHWLFSQWKLGLACDYLM